MTFDVPENTFIAENKATFQHGGRVDDFSLAERAGRVCVSWVGGECRGREIERWGS
jgi:hypothetical protein